MFYQMITAKRNRWLASPECTVKDLLDYIKTTGQMRDAQIEAIQTYLFLKIGCACKPLSELFCQGKFNNLDLDDIELKTSTKEFLSCHPAAAALFEYSRQKDDSGNQVSAKLEAQLKKAPESIDYEKFFRDALYGVSYTDYLFSLPMGAGKTYLMAAFIYLDLYFALNEPENRAFAHNFIIFAPSGLKSSVVPSLKTIQKFDPAWIIPEPAASELKRQIIFEVLDQSKTASKSNKTKNPNVQKIASHQPLHELFGLVAVTNAEKVILDRIQEKGGQITLFEDSDDEKDRQANELRNLISKLPALSIFIDEVHHAVSDEIKLRAVINRWAENNTVNSVIGFSGTPYLEKAEKIAVTDNLSVATAEITNIVYYYPLIDGVGNFLKQPIVKIEDVADSAQIIERGVRLFLDTYRDTIYPDGTTAKLGIYCGGIKKLEEVVYPIVADIAKEYGLSSDTILRFHKGNEEHPQPADSQMQFDTLDKPISKIRIVLLVQIGKEGWDCRSLTGIILSQEGDCPKNMVLQTSCRCLRQVDRGQPETALIYLNKVNADKLNDQLQQQHHISLKEFQDVKAGTITLERHDRTAYLKLPKVDFCQLKINFATTTVEPAQPEKLIPETAAKKVGSTRKTTDLTMKTLSTEIIAEERGTDPANFMVWLYSIVRESFGTLKMEEFTPYLEMLRTVFDTITYEQEGSRYFSSQYDQMAVRANIRKAFCEVRTFETQEETVPQESSLLNIVNFKPIIDTTPEKLKSYYPEQAVVKNIVADDAGKLKMKPDIAAAIATLEADDNPTNRALAETLRKQNTSHPQKDRSFHYLPYHTDSSFEQTFLDEVLPYIDSVALRPLQLKVYYNGDDTLTEFKIRCYKSTEHGWVYVGMYTPDFLIIQRKDGKIHKVLIVETKGGIYANDPKFRDKRKFTETEFIRQNNAAFGYQRFEYLYLEDTMPERERIIKTHDKICEFFGGFEE